MKKILCAIALALISMTGWAQYTGPSDVPKLTVAQLLEKGKDDQYVALRGKLVRHIGGKDYMFSDDSGEIRAEIKPALLQGVTVDANTEVEIEGEFDKSLMETPEVEVKKLRIAP